MDMIVFLLADLGPDMWWVYYPLANGRNQSPIDIVPERAEFNPDLLTYPLRVNYFDARTLYVQNTGHTWQVDARITGSCKSYKK
jgi:carbonic anhydrase